MPTFGPALRSEWLLDPDLTYLNHGTVGATPRRVLAHQRAITDEIERHPARFMLRELADDAWHAAQPTRLRVAAAAVAEFVGVARRGPGVRRQHHHRRQRGSAIVPVRRPATRSQSPTSATAASSTPRRTSRARSAARCARSSCRSPGGADMTTSRPSPLVWVPHPSAGRRPPHARNGDGLPLAEIAALCHERGVLVLADGAHVPGNIAVDIDSLGVDWYVANLHKWAWAPRSAGLLWSAKQHQGYLHPTVISWGSTMASPPSSICSAPAIQRSS